LIAANDVVVPAIRLFELFPNHPILTVNKAVKLLHTTSEEKSEKQRLEAERERSQGDKPLQ
jgi:hypothetical protein